jgi:hypothetical protein
MRISAASVKWPLILLCVLGVFSCVVPAAVAGLAGTPFALFDGFGPDAGRWRGSASIDVDPVSPPIFLDEMEAEVEWAAFAPGKFALYLAAEHPGAVDPSGLGEVTYAYQVVSVGKAVPGIDSLTVGVDAADGRGSVGPTFVALTGGSQDPSSSSDQITSMLWQFAPGAAMLGVGESSPILVFTSPFAPELDTMNVGSGLATTIPSPRVASISDRLFEFEIPEPASLALFVLGVGVMLSARRFRD